MKKMCNNQGSLLRNICKLQVFKGMKYNLAEHNFYFLSNLFLYSFLSMQTFPSVQGQCLTRNPISLYGWSDFETDCQLGLQVFWAFGRGANK